MVSDSYCLLLWYPCTGDTKFDASQYDFFGNNPVEEVELGGLDDDDGDTAFVEHGNEVYPLYGRDNMLEVADDISLLCLRKLIYVWNDKCNAISVFW